jgi:hypothetical protein
MPSSMDANPNKSQGDPQVKTIEDCAKMMDV